VWLLEYNYENSLLHVIESEKFKMLIRSERLVVVIEWQACNRYIRTLVL